LVPGFATVSVLRPRPVPAAVTRSTTAYAGYTAAAAAGTSIVGVSGHVKKPATFDTVAEPVPVTSAAVGSPPAVAHRSQKIVPVPYVVLAAKLTFDSVKPYRGDGVTRAAAHAVVAAIAYLCVPLTPLRTPPGALVVSTRTTVEPTTCAAAVGKAVPVTVGEGDWDAVFEGVGELVRDGVAELVCDGVDESEEPPEGVCEFDGVCDGEGGTATYETTATLPARPFAPAAAHPAPPLAGAVPAPGALTYDALVHDDPPPPPTPPDPDTPPEPPP